MNMDPRSNGLLEGLTIIWFCVMRAWDIGVKTGQGGSKIQTVFETETYDGMTRFFICYARRKRGKENERKDK